MEIYPAIDLHQGQCVRLVQGRFDKVTVYDDNPLALAQSMRAQGTKWLHVVDLDGARDPDNYQSALIGRLVKETALNIQVGGGISERERIAYYFEQGASRVVIGSMAVKAPEMVKSWLAEFGSERIVIALDVYAKEALADTMVAIAGWQETSELSLQDCLNNYQDGGLKHVLCTDIARDGVLSGPNIRLYDMLHATYPALHIQASGGCSSLADIMALRVQEAASAVIIGRALYEGRFTLKEALSC